MNEHDSERIAGLLEADGYSVAETEDEANVIVLNTCCIRETLTRSSMANLAG